MTAHKLFALLIVAVSLAWLAAPAQAQWKTQRIPMQPGWNAVFLEVHPEPAEVANVFAGLPVKSVWAWNRRLTPVQFVVDTNSLIPGQPDWLTYVPAESEGSFVTNLHALQGGRAYLVHLGGSDALDLDVVGTPVTRPPDWLPDSWNLAGFYVDATAPPTFEGYLAPSAAHTGNEVFQLGTDGRWRAVPDRTIDEIQAGEAYWIFTNGSSSYPGPIRVTTEQSDSLDFGRILNEQVLRIRNETDAAYEVTLRLRDSAAAPAAKASAANDFPLDYWDSDGESPSWVEFAAIPPMTIEPFAEEAVRIAVRRGEMNARDYQGLLELSVDNGAQLTVPVRARGSAAAALAKSTRSASVPPDPRAGLWTGIASVNAVAWVTSEPTMPKPTPSEFQIRLIVHVDSNGQAKLLRRAILVWEEGEFFEDPENEPGETFEIVEKPGRFVLLTNDDRIAEYSGAALRDGKQTARRISSAAFGFSDPVPMSGEFDINRTLVSDAIPMEFDDPLNPFLHRFHPDHDNLRCDANGVCTTQDEGVESYTVTRVIELDFGEADPDGLDLPGYGGSWLSGDYRETISGLHRQDLYVAGTFRLSQASRVPVLDGGDGL